jgi:hypothetical protein
MALTWLKKIPECEDTGSDKLSAVNFEEDFMEMEMWKCLLQVDTELEVAAIRYSFVKEMPHTHILCYSKNNCSLQEKLLQNLTIPTSKLLCSLKKDIQKVSRTPCETLTGEQEVARLDMLIGRLLDQADVTTASRLEAMFNHRNQVPCCSTCAGHCFSSVRYVIFMIFQDLALAHAEMFDIILSDICLFVFF